MPEDQPLTVFYDGACPLCAREIAFYRRRRGSDQICWLDVSTSDDGEIAPGLSKDQALARFHVRDGDGKLIAGGRAFAEVWAALPQFRILGNLFRIQPLARALDRAYSVFLKVRPWLQVRIGGP